VNIASSASAGVHLIAGHHELGPGGAVIAVSTWSSATTGSAASTVNIADGDRDVGNAA
jgi:hypothetical protein